MDRITVELTDDQRERLERRGRRRGVESAEAYLQTLVDQLLALMDEEAQDGDGEFDEDVDEAVESKLEALGYL